MGSEIPLVGRFIGALLDRVSGQPQILTVTTLNPNSIGLFYFTFIRLSIQNLYKYVNSSLLVTPTDSW